MSTILDALRRLQRDREGEAEGPRDAAPRPGRYGRGAPRALFVLVGLLIVGVAGGWYYLSDGDLAESAEQASPDESVPGRPLARRSDPPGVVSAVEAVEALESKRQRRPPLPGESAERDDLRPRRPPITPAAEKVLRKRAAARGIPYKEMVKQYLEITPPPPPPLPDRIVVSAEEAMTEHDLEEIERIFAEIDANFEESGQPTSGSLVPRRTPSLRERYSRMEVDPSRPGREETPPPARSGKGTATVKVVSEPPARTAPTSDAAPARNVEPPPAPSVREPAPSRTVQEPELPTRTATPKVARAEPPAPAPPKASAPPPAPPKRSVSEETAPVDFPNVVVQSVRWHPDPERRVVWLELDQTGPLELQEGDIAAGVMVRRIDPSGVELQVGEVRKQVTVGR